jgi:hypothetical protein
VFLAWVFSAPAELQDSAARLTSTLVTLVNNAPPIMRKDFVPGIPFLAELELDKFQST